MIVCWHAEKKFPYEFTSMINNGHAVAATTRPSQRRDRSQLRRPPRRRPGPQRPYEAHHEVPHERLRRARCSSVPVKFATGQISSVEGTEELIRKAGSGVMTALYNSDSEVLVDFDLSHFPGRTGRQALPQFVHQQ